MSLVRRGISPQKYWKLIGVFVLFGMPPSLNATEVQEIRQKPWELAASGLPLEVHEGNLRFSFATKQGTPNWGVLDTGSVESVVDARRLQDFDVDDLREQSPLVLSNPFAKTGGDNFRQTTGTRVRIRDILVGGERRELIAVAVPFDRLYGTADSIPYVLLLGVAPFVTRPLVLDFKRMTAATTVPDDLRVGWIPYVTDDKGVELFKDDPRPILGALSRGMAFPVLIDTGTPYSLRGFNFPGESPARNFSSYTVPTFDSIQIGPLGNTELRGVIRPNPIHFSTYGLEYLKNDLWIFDFPGRRFGRAY